MEFLWIVLALAGIIIALFVDYYLAGCFFEVACEKGFTDTKYMWICFIFGVIGYLLVLALPDRKKEKAEQLKPAKTLFTPQGTQTPSGKWECPQCGKMLPHDVIRCGCGYTK